MDATYISPVKINLTLRVLSRRPDGYHEIISLFWKKKGIEGLTIQPHDNENIGDVLDVSGMKVNGENILFKALRWARDRSLIPPLRMCLTKEFLAGSGIGAGSGNAAALMMYLKAHCGLEIENDSLSSVGADVPFLAGDADLALVEGLGEKIRPQVPLKGLRWVIGFPYWGSDTSAAYRGIDDLRREAKVSLCPEEYKTEAVEILRKLRAGQAAGLLPNDFLEVVSKGRPEYFRAFETAESSGALAWGLSGSGSAFFMVFDDGELSRRAISLLDREDWLIKTTELE
jgi:4-diphosphocytidyl-2-C-methyl-D-erythritol kinase